MNGSDSWEPPDTWLVVYDREGTSVHLDPSEEHRVDAAVEAWISSGCTRDELLSLRMSEGNVYRVLASQVTSFFLNTPERRRRLLMRQQAEREEDKASRQELGLPWEEEQ